MRGPDGSARSGPKRPADGPGPRRPGSRRAGQGLALALAAAGLAGSDAPPLAEMRWLAPGADPVAALGMQPPECLSADRAAPTPRERLDIEIGRAAFRSPLILGGQAARAGISCESCHRNGRSNPHFRFPGVSGAPGTADVTSSLFSSRRGNGVVDPAPIPDLGGARERLKVIPRPEGLAAFIRGLVVEEFDGPEPSPRVLAGLAAYVRSIGPDLCDGSPEPVTAAGYLQDAARAVDAGAAALAEGDRDTALAMLAAARTRLGRIDERYAGLDGTRARLRRSSAGLAGVEALIRSGHPAAPDGIRAWRADLDALRQGVRRDEPRSLFNPERLAAATRLPAGGR
ncbi:MAG: hypothetical protein ACOY4K_08180 [Pseudomonadota bacterium]